MSNQLTKEETVALLEKAIDAAGAYRQSNRKGWNKACFGEVMEQVVSTRAYRYAYSNLEDFCLNHLGVSMSTVYDSISFKDVFHSIAYHRTARKHIESELSKKRRKKFISNKVKWAIWERDNFTCQYCGIRRFLTIDHKQPESAGGGHFSSNLITACDKCNKSKGTKPWEEFILCQN